MPQKHDAFTAADVAVAIVSYNTRELLERCIASILRERSAGIVVIDNASVDGSVESVRRRFPDVVIVANNANVGYGAAVNQALRNCRAPLVLVLNADTELKPGCLEALAAQGNRTPRAGIVAPAIVNRWGAHEPSVFPFPGTLDWLLENAPLAAVVRHVPPLLRRSVSLRPLTAARRVPWAMGCALLLRRECMDAVAGFDEGFFMYYEEVDLCRRATDAGWEVHFSPDAVVMHVGGASTSQSFAVMTIHHFQSTMRYYHRYYAGARLAFWIVVLRLKRRAMLARDSLRLLLARDAGERALLRDQKRAWAGSLEVSRAFTEQRSGVDVGDERAS